MGKGLMFWPDRGSGVEFRDDGKAVVTLVVDADEAAWYAKHLPKGDSMTDNFVIIADRLRGSR